MYEMNCQNKKCNESWTWDSEDFERINKIKFCPFCGFKNVKIEEYEEI